MRSAGYEEVAYVPNMWDLPDRLKADCVAGDLIITLGAGTINEVADALTAGASSSSPARGGG